MKPTPVVFLSAKGDIVDKSVGFNSGADDYLVKPFLTEELVLRVKVWLNRRARAAAATDARAKGSLRVGDLEVFFKKYEARLRGEAVALSSREFELLELLASEAGTVFTREQIIDALWEHREAAGTDAIEVSSFSAGSVTDYDAIAFGCPAMGAEELDPDFEEVWGDCVLKFFRYAHVAEW